MQPVSQTLGLLRSLLVYRARPLRMRALGRFLGGLVRPGDLVFDVGAHAGNRSLAMARLGARVVAVEPQPLFADLLQRNLRGRLLALEKCALGAAPGTTTLHISSRHPTVSTTSKRFVREASQAEAFRNVRWDSETQVAVKTLDMLIARYGVPAFCKIDVEGAEAEILSGLSHDVAVIAFEYVPANRAVALEAIDRICRLGDYRFNRVVGEGHRWTNPDWRDAGAMRSEIEKLAEDARSGDIYAARHASPVSEAAPQDAG